MKKIIYAVAIFILSTLLASKCKEQEPPVEQVPVGGTGGNITIVAFPEHHGKAIKSLTNYADTAYIKFNTLELPGTNPALFDTFFVGETGEDHVHLTGMKRGNYYLYMGGYDSSILARVSGGVPVSYKTFGSDAGEVDLHVPVTE